MMPIKQPVQPAINEPARQQFEALATELDTHLEELTDRVIREAIHTDVSEAAEAAATKALPERVSQAPSEATAGDVDSAKGSPT